MQILHNGTLFQTPDREKNRHSPLTVANLVRPTTITTFYLERPRFCKTRRAGSSATSETQIEDAPSAGCFFFIAARSEQRQKNRLSRKRSTRRVTTFSATWAARDRKCIYTELLYNASRQPSYCPRAILVSPRDPARESDP